MTRARVTMSSSIERDATGKFLPGHSGHGGRQKYSRNRLGHALVESLSKDFDQFGDAAVRKVRESDAVSYLRIVATIVPQKMDVAVNVTNVFAEYNLTDPTEFAKAWEIAKAMVYKKPLEIEQDIVEVEQPPWADGLDEPNDA